MKNEVKGCLIEKKGRYYTTIYYYVDGERITETKATGISVNDHKKREAERILKERIDTKEKSLASDEQLKTQHSFADCFEKWIAYKSQQIETSTAVSYYDRSKTIIDYFRQKNISIEQLESKDLLAFYEWALKYGRRNVYTEGASTALSRRTVSDQAILIKSFLNDAIVQKVISVNPANSVSVPRVKEDKTEEIAYMDKDEAKRFLAFLKAEPFFNKLHLICKIGFYLGCRRSEILGLKWNAIDFTKGEIEIKHTAVRTSQSVIYTDNVKTNSSHRYLPLLNTLKKDLLLHKEYQIMNGTYRDNGYVFLKEDGTQYNPDYISKLFKKAVDRCPNVPKNVTFHGLRHSCCAILFQEGKSIAEVQNWLGHSDITVTANIYNHVSKKWKNQQGESLDGMLD